MTVTRKLTVAVLTYKRPERLRRGLSVIVEHVQALNMAGELCVHADVLVIDNDPAGSAQQVTEQRDPKLVHYVLEPEPGISAGRNRALDEASDADMLVFIDDDEEPEGQWLYPLIKTWQETGAAAVMGRVVSVFEKEPGPWIRAGEFFVRRRMRTGTHIGVAAAGNLLLDVAQIRESGARFHRRFGLTGGEDTLFSRMLTRSGKQIVWCDESVAEDFVPADRINRKWVLARAWSHGNSATLVELYLAENLLCSLALRIRMAARGLLRIGGGSARFGYGLFGGSLRNQARGLRSAMRGAGMLAGAMGVAYQEYSRKRKAA
ncbi:glycosyltransferase [Arthrobacter sp. UYEF3]|uniref:glycosyltransferase family 2 protein n=1 Tax=Arthrobacter sp. UYEF3 TaxID=1756365 RepID=UPI003393766A